MSKICTFWTTFESCWTCSSVSFTCKIFQIFFIFQIFLFFSRFLQTFEFIIQYYRLNSYKLTKSRSGGMWSSIFPSRLKIVGRDRTSFNRTKMSTNRSVDVYNLRIGSITDHLLGGKSKFKNYLSEIFYKKFLQNLNIFHWISPNLTPV